MRNPLSTFRDWLSHQAFRNVTSPVGHGLAELPGSSALLRAGSGLGALGSSDRCYQTQRWQPELRCGSCKCQPGSEAPRQQRKGRKGGRKGENHGTRGRASSPAPLPARPGAPPLRRPADSGPAGTGCRGGATQGTDTSLSPPSPGAQGPAGTGAGPSGVRPQQREQRPGLGERAELGTKDFP